LFLKRESLTLPLLPFGNEIGPQALLLKRRILDFGFLALSTTPVAGTVEFFSLTLETCG
jgi:hypothetical protein